jgi:hypothetical protein
VPRRVIARPSPADPALGAADRPPRIDDHQQTLGVSRSVGVSPWAGEHVAGEPDQVIAVMGDVGDDGAGLGDAVGQGQASSGTTATRGGLLLFFQPLLDGGAAIVNLAPGADAGRTGALGLPTAQRVNRQAEFDGEIKTTDPADQQRTGFVLWVWHRSKAWHWGLPVPGPF